MLSIVFKLFYFKSFVYFLRVKVNDNNYWLLLIISMNRHLNEPKNKSIYTCLSCVNSINSFLAFSEFDFLQIQFGGDCSQWIWKYRKWYLSVLCTLHVRWYPVEPTFFKSLWIHIRFISKSNIMIDWFTVWNQFEKQNSKQFANFDSWTKSLRFLFVLNWNPFENTLRYALCIDSRRWISHVKIIWA